MRESDNRTGYLRGLLESSALKETSVSRKLFTGIVDMLEEITERMDEMEDLIEDLDEYVESIDDDLTALEEGDDEDPFDFLDEDYDEDDVDDEDGAPAKLHVLSPDRPGKFAIPMAVVCPECQRAFNIGLSDPDGARYQCPFCEKTVQPIDIEEAELPFVKYEE